MFPLGAKTTLCGAIAEITGIDMGILTGVSKHEHGKENEASRPLIEPLQDYG